MKQELSFLVNFFKYNPLSNLLIDHIIDNDTKIRTFQAISWIWNKGSGFNNTEPSPSSDDDYERSTAQAMGTWLAKLSLFDAITHSGRVLRE